MRLVLQRVSEASVSVEEKMIGVIGAGLVVFLCIEKGDTETMADRYAGKVASLRIFEDDEGKMNRSLLETGGKVLLISQFTLAADAEKGRRPSFDKAAAPDLALPLYEYFAGKLKDAGVPVVKGVFQAMMKVALVNDGPVTLILGI
ncbi:D-aminoacyl-tRNA deacylase [bacterium]|nr:D-aminoacyl-tRNA deacylase [bacterium]MCI0602426.1 D-aminoacyl-tRNA deacylase [bacterium]